MTSTRKLSEQELRRVRQLEAKLRLAARRGTVDEAKRITADLQPILRNAGQETRLQKAKAWLFEAALEAGELGFAMTGFTGIRTKTRKTTRIYLEATALLAVCHLRLGELEAAKPLMAEAYARVRNIKSPRRRRQFYRRLADRFEEEWAVSILSTDSVNEDLDPVSVQESAGVLVATTTEQDIYLRLGEYLPKHKVDLLLEVYQFSHKQLPSAERALLPSPEAKRRRREVGNTLFRATRRAIWKALCDPESDTYKMWFNQGLMVAMDKKVVGASVVFALTGLGLGSSALAIPITAIVIKLGVDVVCEAWSADGLMIGLDE